MRFIYSLLYLYEKRVILVKYIESEFLESWLKGGVIWYKNEKKNYLFLKNCKIILLIH